MQVILQWILMVIFIAGWGGSQYTFGGSFPKPVLQKGEKRFHTMKSYTLDDFHFKWHIRYFDVVTYEADRSLKLKKEGKFETLMHAGKVELNKRRKRELLWLSKAILKKSYFWGMQYPLFEDYRFTSLRFIDESGRFKAIDTLQDIRDMLGNIDTEAELRLWILASERRYGEPYSYKKTGKLYRVRFREIFVCSYEERFRYYNKEGDVVKNKKIKEIHKKNCEEPVM